jgi:3-oxoacyl-[acyl-carrier protein] reductase
LAHLRRAGTWRQFSAEWTLAGGFDKVAKSREITMDLGIAGKRALVCAGSKGLGRGCAEALAQAGVSLVLNARGAEALEATAAAIRAAHGVDVVTVAADITSDAGRAQVLAAAGDVDILVTNAGGPPPGLWSDWEREDFIKALDANMLTPIALMKALLPGMMARGWGRVVNITSQSVKSPIPVLGLSNAARAGLTGYVAGTARQVAPHGVTINNLLPGIHDTDRATALDGGVVKAEGITLDEARARRMATIPARRYGTSAEFGAACAFLCSQHAGFIVGQNILLDGGAVNSTM